MAIEAILFDLDGTLADSAPDLGAALNRLREEAGLPPFPLDILRPYASAGARGLIGAGFGLAPDHALYPDLQRRFLAHYASRICVDTRLFPGVVELLAELDRRGIRWGVVTNKIERYTRPLLKCLGLHDRAACIVSGDSAAKPKPDPAPLLMACEIARVRPRNVMYVGDDERDVQAGRAAGMHTVIAAWGYLNGVPIKEWGADTIIDHPADVLVLIDGP
ncbi:Phosphoglycolate phosphatase [Georgfuchsia toluolica]|uniref:Phosphoglycolate phosphatase n=1 Tax=Georgfuchsia toluolica TaxID=424218 RepID=A0A916NHD7_9PROT|nr:phosphoglycolate phosphatase [Georgfuchsia toluolica]CAG4883226.1 Phosphoglycolate phosphatase [Georgfuchsia toluolica]